MGSRVLYMRWPGHTLCPRGGAGLFTTAHVRCRSRSLKVFASDAPPKRESLFPLRIFEKVKVRLGFKEQTALLPVVDEEVEQELARGILMGENLIELKKKEGEETEMPVVRDDLFSEVLWEGGERNTSIEENQIPILTSPGLSFSAAGHLFPYHLGVCDCLIEHGYLTESTPLAGSSAGALVCAVVAGGLGMIDALTAAKEVARDCRENGTAFRLGAVLRRIMEKYLPEDAHLKASGRIRVAVTQVFRKPRGLIVDQFDSKEDLINALHTSCFIPGYFAPNPVTVFRGRVCIDGGFTLFMPLTSAEETIRICAFFASAYKIAGVQISPDCNPSESRLTNQQLLGLAFNPAEDEVLDEIFHSGYEDALCWVKQQSDGSS